MKYYSLTAMTRHFKTSLFLVERVMKTTENEAVL
jgi:hypothetical protein